MSVLDSLNKIFQTRDEKGQKSGYRHENESAILKTAKKVLEKSETGARLLQMSDERSISITLIKNKKDCGYIPNSKTVYVSEKAGKKQPEARLVLMLGGALREAEQELLGYKRPTADDTPEEFVVQNAAKQLDIVRHQCAIAYELNKNIGLAEMLDEIGKMGHSEILSLYIKEIETKNG